MLLLLPGLICDARVYAPQKSAFPDAHVVDGYGMADSLARCRPLARTSAARPIDSDPRPSCSRLPLEHRPAPGGTANFTAANYINGH
jgi:hypothetical protein